MSKFITAQQAAELVADGMTVAVSGFGAYAAPDELLARLADRYAAQGILGV
jgi:propionate CoA-transferase